MVRATIIGAEPGSGGGAAARLFGLSPAPPSVTRACERSAREVAFPVRCPTRWPAGRGRADNDFGAHPRTYLIELSNGFSAFGAKAFHLFLGGQDRPFGRYDPTLGITTLQRVPMRDGGMFTSSVPPRALGVADVNGAVATILSEPPYPQGGIHGGHVLVTWTADGRGYLVSLHAVHMTQRVQVRAALAIARSAIPVRASGG